MKINTATRLDRALSGWVYNFARRNYWRVEGWYSLEDLVQDGFECYARCRLQYGHVIERRRFIALVKASFQNHVTDLANQRTKAPEVRFHDLAPDETRYQDLMDRVIGTESELGSIFLMVKTAPAEVKQVFNLLLTDIGQDALSTDSLPCNGGLETNNQWLCRLLGFDPEKINLPKMINEFLMTPA